MTPSKKRKSSDADSSAPSSKKMASTDKAVAHEGENGDGYVPLSLDDIRERIQSLCVKVPKVPADLYEPTGSLKENVIRDWAAQFQAVLEEFNLLVGCVSAATYKWGTDRSGAADQNLSLLSGEMAQSQDQISSSVSPRLTNVLAPVVDLVIEKVTVTKKENGDEIKENHYARKLVDPDFVRLCHKILARNAPLLRHLVMANFHKLLRCMKDYMQAQKNDSKPNSFAY